MGSGSSKRYRYNKNSIIKAAKTNTNGKIISTDSKKFNSKEKKIANDSNSLVRDEAPKSLQNNTGSSIGEESLEPKSLPPKTDLDGSVTFDKSVLTSKELYNILVAETWLRQPQLLENLYLLLLDCRSEEEYALCHIVTARHRTSINTQYGCLINVPGQLEAFNMIVIYGDEDESVSSLMHNRNVSFFKVKTDFSAFKSSYPFLCTDVLYKTVNERKQHLQTWPSEVIDGKIYQGNAAHALDENVINVLGITHIINITLDRPNAFQTVQYMRIQLDDEVHVDLLSWLEKTNKFIYDALHSTDRLTEAERGDKKNNRVLVHCNFGRSRSSTIVLGYMMKVNRWSLLDACEWLKDCRPTVKPNIGFLKQLLIYEKKLFGRQLSDLLQLPF